MPATPTDLVFDGTVPTADPLGPSERPVLGTGNRSDHAHAAQPPLLEDSAATKAEKVERNGRSDHDDLDQRSAKKVKYDYEPESGLPLWPTARAKGVAPIKAEHLVHKSARIERPEKDEHADSPDDAQEAKGKNRKGKGRDNKGQNSKREFGSSYDAIKLCTSRAIANEFDPPTCRFGASCKFEHDIRKYLRDGKRGDLDTFDGKCPIFEAHGKCSAGWKCRFASSHSEEREVSDGRMELVLLQTSQPTASGKEDAEADAEAGIVNVVSAATRILLRKHQIHTPKTEPYSEWLNKMSKESEGSWKRNGDREEDVEAPETNGTTSKPAALENSAMYTSPPFLPSEKRRLYYGPETPVLAPLTTQGNLPFRRLCVSLGAQITWSEMAMSLPLIQGERSEWSLMKAHPDELCPPVHSPKTPVIDYNRTTDIKFGAQIAGNKPWLALKATEILTILCPSLRAIDLNCGCPIDLVFRQGAGSALMDTPGKLEKILRGMNAVSGEVPITVKIRMGTRDNKPTADKLVSRLAFGGPEALQYGQGPCGVAALTLHGRSRQQRYTRNADWSYIAECAATIKSYNKERDEVSDTVREPDPRDLANSKDGRVYFCGNGDCYSHEDYDTHIANAGVDSVMVARGALIKPWIFEEIAAGQHLDKSASERLSYIEKFTRNGLETWGSDEMGVGLTRRFLLEWLSFSCRYVPVGLLEVLPPNIQDRPPAYRGRNELETLLSSDNYRDWIKISEMFLGPAHKDFRFAPKHKSNSYDIEAEG